MNPTFDRRLIPARPDLAASSLRETVEATRFVEPRRMRVSASSAPLRREPRPDAALDTEALHGEAVDLFESHEGWAWVQLAGDGYVGYLPDDALRADAAAPTHRLRALMSFVYPGPSIKLPPLARLSFGAALSVRGESGEFAVLTDGGHVFARHLAPAAAAEPDFVAAAEGFERLPYLWGGKTSAGIDCSGLVQLSLGAAGVAAPRDTDLQEKALGEALPVDEALGGLKRGDLVFWKGHVGIMTDAATLLHATAFTMTVLREPLRTARDRIRAGSFGEITAIRRLAPAA